MTNWTNVSSLSDIMQVANTNAGGWFWTVMLLMLFVIMFISMLGFGIEAALLGAAFSALMIGIVMTYLGVVAWTWILVYVGVIIVTFLWIIYNQKE